MNIFVGNLSFDVNEGGVKKLFEGFGNVASVVILMRKEKKTPKSRGFGFVEMPDEQQALAAIAALNGKEFMARILNVDRARPKGQKAMVWLPIAKAKAEAHRVTVEAEQYKHLALKVPRPDGRAGIPPSAVDRQVRPSGRPGTYKGGRRTHSYMKRRGLAGMREEVKPRKGSQGNPMRWRKKKDKPRPWQKSASERKPWEKAESGLEAKPWKKPTGNSKPWSKRSRVKIRGKKKIVVDKKQ
ncbi:MAG: hypothetical protein COT38_05185 [Candidatus Omnitrophica bacterium CG08_land_8_20_14_0_20_41_16]|uniref:RRM domain-containing protein n=1 Tax=Candidatus Sherwoodlollariibacterium unditelluris TaxID=1974757 RepID=A0A2G9YJC7_9BACT|nr:MAG: hypothetical protein COX41_03330 [Candidatus Omnitrophica bacterium CG23_combo_of_CG06-09_8_20_14_all_41_10]PIS33464.1 MAG: hypothetical protein COT38_05185 [Candidatus Omnitrophica bacterium CG08_land_8_20_14_0_20_41_16]